MFSPAVPTPPVPAAAAIASLRRRDDRPPVPDAPSPPVMLHRPFFFAAIALTLTLGATWGVTLLWRIGAAASPAGANAAAVNAHGEAQIYGWVGLFIMGFALQMFPRMWRSPAVAPRVAMTVLGLTVIGILVRAVGMELPASSAPAFLAPVLVLGGGACVIAGIAVFSVQMLETYEKRRVPAEPAFLFMFIAICWFILSSVFSVLLSALTLGANDGNQLLAQLAAYQPALRDAQILGMAVTMIIGVSLKILPGAFGLPHLSDRRAMTSLALMTLGIAGACSFSIAHQWTGLQALAIAEYLCHAVMVVGVAAIVSAWRPCLMLPRDDGRSGKFVRVAYVWLMVSLIMLLAQPAYDAIMGLPHSRAFAGAARHAITVGFISMMIMGVASKVVPSLHGAPRRTLSALCGPFLLVNVGCALRVVIQSLTDVAPGLYGVLFISGVFEVAGLAWWSIDLSRHMLRRATDKDFEPVPLTIRSSAETASCCSACAGSAS